MTRHSSRYAISNLGRIFDTFRQEFIKPHIHKSRSNHYLRVALGGKKYMLHVLVAIYHVSNSNKNNLQVDHLDHNTLNPASSNLQWIDQSKNIKRTYERNLIFIEGIAWKHQRRKKSPVGNAAKKYSLSKRKQTASRK